MANSREIKFDLEGDPADLVERGYDPPRFIVKPIIPYGGITLLHGREGHFKSFLALTLCRALALGESFLSTFPPSRARTAIVSVDMPPGHFLDRMEDISEDLRNNVRVWSSGSPIDLMQAEPGHGWVRRVREFEPDLIIFDTLHKCHLLDENLSQTVGAVYSRMKWLFGEHSAFMPIHHNRKDHPNPAFVTEPALRVRGSSAWLANADTGIQITKTGKSGKALLESTKSRYAEPFRPISCVFDPGLQLMEKAKPVGRALAKAVLFEESPETRAEFKKLLQERGDMSRQRANLLANETLEDVGIDLP